MRRSARTCKCAGAAEEEARRKARDDVEERARAVLRRFVQAIEGRFHMKRLALRAAKQEKARRWREQKRKEGMQVVSAVGKNAARLGNAKERQKLIKKFSRSPFNLLRGSPQDFAATEIRRWWLRTIKSKRAARRNARRVAKLLDKTKDRGFGQLVRLWRREGRRVMFRRRHALKKIQRRVREWLPRHLAWTAQRLWRGHLGRLRAAKVRATIRLQGWWRAMIEQNIAMVIHRENMKRRHKGAIAVQRVARGRRGRDKYEAALDAKRLVAERHLATRDFCSLLQRIQEWRLIGVGLELLGPGLVPKGHEGFDPAWKPKGGVLLGKGPRDGLVYPTARRKKEVIWVRLLHEQEKEKWWLGDAYEIFRTFCPAGGDKHEVSYNQFSKMMAQSEGVNSREQWELPSPLPPGRAPGVKVPDVGASAGEMSNTVVESLLAKHWKRGAKVLPYTEWVNMVEKVAEARFANVEVGKQERATLFHDQTFSRTRSLAIMLVHRMLIRSKWAEKKELYAKLVYRAAHMLHWAAAKLQDWWLNTVRIRRMFIRTLAAHRARVAEERHADAVRKLHRFARYVLGRYALRKMMRRVWRKMYDKGNPNPYWVNPRTGTKVWEKPALLGNEEVDTEFVKPDQITAFVVNCANCSENPATEYCCDCAAVYCSACSKDFHENDAAGWEAYKEHKRTRLPHCVQCEYQLASRYCTDCEEDFCDGCYNELHTVGRLTEHEWEPHVVTCGGPTCVSNPKDVRAALLYDRQTDSQCCARCWKREYGQARAERVDLLQISYVTQKFDEKCAKERRQAQKAEQERAEALTKRETRAAVMIQKHWRGKVEGTTGRRLMVRKRFEAQQFFQARKDDATRKTWGYQMAFMLGRAPELESDTDELRARQEAIKRGWKKAGNAGSAGLHGVGNVIRNARRGMPNAAARAAGELPLPGSGSLERGATRLVLSDGEGVSKLVQAGFKVRVGTLRSLTGLPSAGSSAEETAKLRRAGRPATPALPEELRAEAVKAFRNRDENGKGTVKLTVLVRLFEDLGFALRPFELGRIRSASDFDGSGTLDLEEWLDLVNARYHEGGEEFTVTEVFLGVGSGALSAPPALLLDRKSPCAAATEWEVHRQPSAEAKKLVRAELKKGIRQRADKLKPPSADVLRQRTKKTMGMVGDTAGVVSSAAANSLAGKAAKRFRNAQGAKWQSFKAGKMESLSKVGIVRFAAVKEQRAKMVRAQIAIVRDKFAEQQDKLRKQIRKHNSAVASAMERRVAAAEEVATTERERELFEEMKEQKNEKERLPHRAFRQFVQDAKGKWTDKVDGSPVDTEYMLDWAEQRLAEWGGEGGEAHERDRGQ